MVRVLWLTAYPINGMKDGKITECKYLVLVSITINRLYFYINKSPFALKQSNQFPSRYNNWHINTH